MTPDPHYARLIPGWQIDGCIFELFFLQKRDPDLVAAEVAMKRAAQRARERARQVGSGVAVLRDGKIIEERQDS